MCLLEKFKLYIYFALWFYGTVQKFPGDVFLISFHLNSRRVSGTPSGCQLAWLFLNLTGPSFCQVQHGKSQTPWARNCFLVMPRSHHLTGQMSASSNREINKWGLKDRTIHDFKSLTFILELMVKTKKSNAEHNVHNMLQLTHSEALC